MSCRPLVIRRRLTLTLCVLIPILGLARWFQSQHPSPASIRKAMARYQGTSQPDHLLEKLNPIRIQTGAHGHRYLVMREQGSLEAGYVSSHKRSSHQFLLSVPNQLPPSGWYPCGNDLLVGPPSEFGMRPYVAIRD